MIKLFSTFKEASLFAAEYCRLNRCNGRLANQNNGWTFSSGSLQAPFAETNQQKNKLTEEQFLQKALHLNKLRYEEKLSQERLQSKKQDIENLNQLHKTVKEEEEEEEEEEEGNFSSEKEKFLNLARTRSISLLSLNQVMDNFRLYDFTEDELSELTNILAEMRARVPSVAPKVCPSCYQIGINCTCGRSWF